MIERAANPELLKKSRTENTADNETVSANILVIDDEEMIRELFREILNRDGHKVTLASGSREGLQAFREGDYDIVYTDLGMPGISGWQVAWEIKKMAPSTAVVMTTGWEIEMDAEELKKKGVDIIVSKPFQIQQVRNSVAEAMKIAEKTVANGNTGY